MNSYSQISSITKGPRQSNIELLRIFAMFLVLVVHADFWTLGAPSTEDFSISPLNAWARTIIESISIVCVNVFILISGWFGIRFSAKGLINFIFQCAYFLFGIYFVMVASGCISFSLRGLAECFCLTSVNWFIKAYAALYILTPVLNAFVDKASNKQFRYLLIVFFTFQTIWGWSGAATWVMFGYSTFSFIGLYLLARYIRLYQTNRITAWGGGVYILSIVVNSILYWLLCRLSLPIDPYAYVNPLVILGGISLLVTFDRIYIRHSKIINWIAASAFAAFLLHSNPNIGVPIFKVKITELYESYYGIECIGVILGFLIIVFACAVILDQPRKWLWKFISKHF